MRPDLVAPKCPRRGWVMLSTRERDFVMPTTCKTWGCHVCKEKVRQLTALKLMYGCLSTGGPSHFITVTYRKRPGDRTRDAQDVAKDWAALWRQLKGQEAWREAQWIKVPELTKAGQVHLHGIVVLAKGRDTCRKGDYHRKRWMQSQPSGHCLEHDLAHAWYEQTGDSFVVDCETVRSVAGTASYVQKYMAKSFAGDRSTMASLGFKKRWTSSRDWPRAEPLHLLGTELGLWERVTRYKGPWAKYSNHSEDEPVLMRDMAEDQELEAPYELTPVGEPYLLEMRKMMERRDDVRDAMKGLGISV